MTARADLASSSDGTGGAGRIEAVLFDFFGTLVSYAADRSQLRYDAAFRAAVDGFGWAGSYAEWLAAWESTFTAMEAAAERSLIEFSMHDVVETFLANEGLHVPAEVFDTGGSATDVFIAAYLGEWAAPIRPVPGVTETLVELRRRGRRVGIVSNTHHEPMLHALIERFGWADKADLVVASVTHGSRKPHTTIYLDAVGALGVAPAAALFVGDSLACDYQGPIAAGLQARLLIVESETRTDLSVATFRSIEETISALA